MRCATNSLSRLDKNENTGDLLLARGLYKSYRSGKEQLQVLKGIDLSVKKGEVLFIVGPSGAGKSTLLHVLAGLDRPDGGEVAVGGVNVYRLPDRKRSKLRNENIGFVFQFYHLLREFSAIENVMLPGMMRQRRDIHGLRKKAADILARVGLSNRAEHRPAELSGGEQQRVAIARALINSPDILFCDEPTGNLDSENGREVYELIFELSIKRSVTVIVVSHEKDFSGKAVRCVGIKDGILSGYMV